MKNKIIPIAATAILMASSQIAMSADWTTGQANPSSFRVLGHVFEMADRNNDNQLSMAEYSALRMYTMRNSQVMGYRSDSRASMMPTLQTSFRQLDMSSDGSLSLEEFMNASRIMTAAKAMDKRDAAMNNRAAAMSAPIPYASPQVEAPDYVTATYYLSVNKVDTDQLKGKEVVNLDGEKVGTIESIIRAKDSGKYYAMMDLRGAPRRTSTGMTQRDRAGVPLDDVLLSTAGDQLLLSTLGEEALREDDAKLVKNFEVVETLYTL